jgi:hypothetical protein
MCSSAQLAGENFRYLESEYVEAARLRTLPM